MPILEVCKKTFESFKLLLSEIKFNFKVICLTETWARNDISKNSLFQLENYTILYQNRYDESADGGECTCSFIIH